MAKTTAYMSAYRRMKQAGAVKFDENSFFLYTQANFKSTDKPDREPDYVSSSGSQYWYTDDGVVRGSNHWGEGVASCDWTLDGKAYGYGMHPSGYVTDSSGKKVMGYLDGYDGTPENDVKYGFAKWSDFSMSDNYVVQVTTRTKQGFQNEYYKLKKPVTDEDRYFATVNGKEGYIIPKYNVPKGVKVRG